MGGLHEKPMRERLARWVRSSAPAVLSGATSPEEVVDALLDVMLAAPEGSLIYEAGRGELPSRSAGEAKAVFAAMVEAIKAGAS